MSCYADIFCGKRVIIGIRDYDACKKPESDLFIDDLPGISLKTAAKITNEQYMSGAEIINKCIKTAIQQTFDEFQAEISPYFDFNLVVETRQLDKFSDTKILPAVSAERGIIMKRWRSELSEIYVEEIYVKSSASGVASVKIIDGTDLIKTISVDLIADEITTVFVNLRLKKESVKIVMDDTLFPVYSCDRNYYNSTSCRTCSGRYNSNDFYIGGWDGAHEDSNCYGIGVKASVRCYEDNVICSVLPRMYFIIWLKAGILFLRERIYSDRLNPVVQFGADKAKELLDEYQIDYKEKYAYFSKSIYQFLKSTKGECLTCNGTHYVQQHP